LEAQQHLPGEDKMISKAELKHGAYYAGQSKSAAVARWNAQQSLFFARRGTGQIVDFYLHPQDSVSLTGADTFRPYREIAESPVDIPISY
jgi:hypothetical protein